ncbi:hypothetical protein FN846DRAFT_918415 [Sphaerosporella brunnea]|uniref:Histidine kinase n=1 Tax=Sphaerosporella brunnea TaxID=1250544 RepID=A0A5J5EZF9_9PEZI|nr:hypothetical protein FN846DRAFT_918415 [Sphaerosporella brunnea]
MLSQALSFTKCVKKHGKQFTAKKFEICPKCGYKASEADRPTSLPGGINPSILLDSSPSPQLLLSEGNVIVYANKCAARILRVRQEAEDLEEAKTPPNQGDLPFIPLEYDVYDDNLGDEGFEKPLYTGLEGHTIDQLNIDLADHEIRPFLSLLQVFENIKLKLSKREATMKGTKTSDRAEMYGEGPKYNSYDYYGDQEKAKGGQGEYADHVVRDTVLVVVEREDGKEIQATMYVALVDPYSTGYCYSSVSLIPGAVLEDATFSEQTTVETKTRRRRKRDRLREKVRSHGHDHHDDHDPETSHVEELLTDRGIGESGENMIKRVTRIKDRILDQMDYCFIALSPDGDIVITNAATKAILGQETLKASIGEGFEWIARLDIWRPDFSERLPFEEWALNRLITHRQPLTQVIGMYAGTIPLVVELRGKCVWEDPIKEEGLLAALAIVVDQTQWFSKEKQMQDVQVRQEMFIKTISRELKTPVAGIIGLLELLYGTNKDLNEEQLGYIRQIFGSLNSLLLVIQDITDFNRITAGEVVIARNAFVLQDMVDEIKTLFSESMSKEGIEFEVNTSGIDKSAFGDGTRFILIGDDSKIRRIAVNMLSNAFRFTVKGKVSMTVLTQKVMRNSLEVKFIVKDTGVGITEEDQQRLFAPLDELSAQDARSIGVDGIGLNIARKFVSLLAGEIGCDSVIDKGTTFWFTVPCGRPSPDTEVTFGPPEKTLSKTLGIVIHSKDLESRVPKETAKVHIEGTVVLLVEDNWAHSVVMEKRLQVIGCEVLKALNGRDAIKVLKTCDKMVDVIFMDIQMPLLNGFETTKFIRKDSTMLRFRNIPIIGLTAVEEKGDRERAKECGIDEFAVKPLNNEITRKYIEDLMDPVAVGKRRLSKSTAKSL